MNTLNNQHSESLRDVNLMIAYLRDKLSLEEVIEIEDLMEKDELYRLSMEQLSNQLVDSTPRTLGQNILQIEQSLPQLLVAQKESFIAHLDKNGGNNDSDSSWIDRLKNGSNWQKLLALAVVPLLIYFAVIPLTREDKLHKKPTENIIPNDDVYAAEVLMQNCKDYSFNPGIGSGAKEISIFTAIVDEYTMNENYKNASQQLELISNDERLSVECKAMVDFYLANSYMALNDYGIATRMFMKVLMNQATPSNIMNASHWYLANIYLIQNDYQAAKKQFDMLLDGEENEDHLQKLMDKKYLEEAKTYIQFLENK